MPFDPSQFQLHPLNDTQWLIHDTEYCSTDPQYAVAFIERDENDLATVVWLRDTPLPAHYATPDDALTDLRLFASQTERFTRPIEIPHIPPMAP